MKVRELIAKLQEFDPEAEAHRADSDGSGWTSEIEEVYAGTTRYGILTATPTTVDIVVLSTGTEGL